MKGRKLVKCIKKKQKIATNALIHDLLCIIYP